MGGGQKVCYVGDLFPILNVYVGQLAKSSIYLGLVLPWRGSQKLWHVGTFPSPLNFSFGWLTEDMLRWNGFFLFYSKFYPRAVF